MSSSVLSEARQELWDRLVEEFTDCRKDAVGNRPCDTTGYCPYHYACDDEELIARFNEQCKNLIVTE